MTDRTLSDMPRKQRDQWFAQVFERLLAGTQEAMRFSSHEEADEFEGLFREWLGRTHGVPRRDEPSRN